MHKQMSITIHLLFKLAITNMAHMQYSHVLKLFALKCGQISLSRWTCMVLAHMVDKGLDRIVIIAAQLASLPNAAVRCFVFSHVTSVAAPKITLGTFEVISSVFTHVCVQIPFGIGVEITLMTGEWLELCVDQAV